MENKEFENMIIDRSKLFEKVNVVYNPQEDITTYELSRIIPFMLGKELNNAEWAQLGSAQRHLQKI
jgi:hypothetical protein